MKLTAAFLLLLGLSFQGPAQNRKLSSPQSSQIAATEAYCREIDSFIKSNSTNMRVFANTASGTEQVPDNWQEFGDERERQAADTGDNLNETAYVWIRNGNLVGANFTFQSPSRDWAQFVMYFFREDGSLAKTDETLNTFYGNMSVDREKLYDATGKLLRSSTKYSDLKTKRKRTPDRNFQNEDAPVYRTVRALPFYALLKEPRPTEKPAYTERRRRLRTVQEVETDQINSVGVPIVINGAIEISSYYNYRYAQAQGSHLAFQLSDATGRASVYMPRGDAAARLRQELLDGGGKLKGSFTIVIRPERFDRTSSSIFAELVDFGPPIK